MDFAVAVAWHDVGQRDSFLRAWGLRADALPPWLFLQHDVEREGGARTKNKAMRRAADAGADVIVSMDDDCYPVDVYTKPAPGVRDLLASFALCHVDALAPQPVRMFEVVTDPPSRGTPFEALDLRMPVAASMGFWTEVGDYCGPRQLVYGASNPAPMTFRPQAVHGRYFPLCAMNYAFRPAEWAPFFYLVEGVGRFDDIWMGWMWQRAAYARGFCFNLAGPNVRHARQSNVWRNLRVEAQRIEASETLWRDIASSTAVDYESLRAIVQPHVGADGADYAAPRRG